MKVGEPYAPFRYFTGPIIPLSLLSYRGISAAAKLCLGRLMMYASRETFCFPSQKELAKELGVTIRSVHEYLSELEADGFILIRQNGLNKSNTYQLLGHRVFCEDSADVSQVDENTGVEHMVPVKSGIHGSDQETNPWFQSHNKVLRESSKENHGKRIIPPANPSQPSAATPNPIGTGGQPEHGGLGEVDYGAAETVSSGWLEPPEATGKIITRVWEAPDGGDYPEPISAPSPVTSGPAGTAGEVSRPHVAITESDLQPGTPVAEFVRNMYRQNRHAKYDPRPPGWRSGKAAAQANLDEALEAAESSVGADEFRAGLLTYLSDDSAWLRENRWPIRGYLERLRRFVGSGITHRASRVPSARPASAGVDGGPSGVVISTPVAPSLPDGLPMEWVGDPPTRIPAMVARWNETVKAGHPVKVWKALRDPMERAWADEDFRNNYPALLDTVQQLCSKGDMSLSFGWLLETKNWTRVLNGDFNWSIRTKRKRGGQETGMDLVEGLRKKIRKGEVLPS